jgi:hypothetical protein
VSALTPDHVELSLAGTEYRLRLALPQPAPGLALGKPASGVVRVKAKRVDPARAGGRYIEPVFGRPRRVQGLVTSIDPHAQTITVLAACPVVARLLPSQRAEAFEAGDLVGFEVEPDASFTPAAHD